MIGKRYVGKQTSCVFFVNGDGLLTEWLAENGYMGNKHFFLFLVWMTSLYFEESRSFCRFFLGGWVGWVGSDLLPEWFVLSFCVNTRLYIWKLQTVFVLTALWTGNPPPPPHTHTQSPPASLSVYLSVFYEVNIKITKTFNTPTPSPFLFAEMDPVSTSLLWWVLFYSMCFV